MNRARTVDLRSLWPELSACVALIVCATWLASEVVHLTGEFSYCLDDAYIHLAIAKNLVQHHVWGVTQYEFASASSSPLWILVLAANVAVVGVNLYLPLGLNLLFASASLFVAAATLRRRSVPQPLIAVLLLAIAYLSAMATLILSGMEHTLHILLVFTWVYLLDDIFRTSDPLSRRQVGWLAVLGGAMTLCRYESLFLVFISCGLLLLRRERLAAVVVGGAAWIPIALFGAFSVAHGWHWLPNSVLIKSMGTRDWSTPEHVFDALAGRAVGQLFTNNFLIPLVVAVLAGIWWLGRRGIPVLTSPRALLVCSAAMMFLHLQFASMGWFFRYEAYLIAMGILVLGIALAPLPDGQLVVPGPRWLVAVASLALCIPLGLRGYGAFMLTPIAGQNIYDQQVQIGRFLGVEMGDAAVALNDIGGPSLFSNVHVVDYYGLATLDTADWRLTSGPYTPEAVQEIARRHHVQLAIVHAPWLGPAIPPSWHFIASWRAPDPDIGLLGNQTVSFYAVDRTPDETRELVAKIVEFSRQLPPGSRVGMPRELVDQGADAYSPR